MTNQDLAKFYNISAQAVGRWSVEKRKQKTVQALANAEQPIVDLIADISKLVFVFNCKWLHGDVQVKCIEVEITHEYIQVGGTDFWAYVKFSLLNLEEKLQSIKTKLEELVYGLQE